MDIAITNGWIITGDNEGTEFTKGNILIKDGILIDITEDNINPDRPFDRVIDACGKVIIPGLINAHTHSYANLTKWATGTIPLEIWMLYVSAMGSLFEPEDIYYSALLGIAEMLKSGTTACTDQ